jgi:hypothetical protein
MSTGLSNPRLDWTIPGKGTRQSGPSATRGWLRKPPLGTIGKMAAGLVLGVILTVAVLVLWAPTPQPLAAAAPTGSDITISVSDAYLSRTAGLAISHAQLPVTIGNVQAHTEPGNQLTFSGQADALFGFVQRPLAATSQLTAEHGHLALHITNATVGGLPLPAPVTGLLESAVNTQLANVTNQLTSGNSHLVVTGVATGGSQVTITFQQQS